MASAAVFVGIAVLALLRARGGRKSDGKTHDSVAVRQGNGSQRLVVEIKYCCRCRWGTRAAWMAQELLNTFEKELHSVNLAPSMEGGVFVVTLRMYDQQENANQVILFDRKAMDGEFPQPKQIKLALRNAAFPEQTLGKCLEKAKEIR